MKLFVTGGTGFIGSHFIKQALAAGHAVRAIRRKGSQPRIALPTGTQWLDVPFEMLEAVHFEGIDVVVHLAAHSANVPYDSLENCLHWNVTIPVRMARVAAIAGVKNFIIAGSCFEYGLAGIRYAKIPADASMEPTLSYPTSKAAASIALAGFAREAKVKLLIGRIFQVYGIGEGEKRFWPSLKRAAETGVDFQMSSGNQIRDFIPVEEVAAWFCKSLYGFTELEFGNPIFKNVATGIPTSLADFAKKIWVNANARGSLQIGSLHDRPGELARLVGGV